MKLYLKLFLATGIPYGLIMGLYRGDANTGLVLGFIFGTFMSVVLGTMQIIFTRNSKSGTSGVSQAKTIELQLPFYKTCNLCVASLESINGRIAEKTEQEEGAGAKVVAKTKMNWKSFGETVQFDILKVNSDKTEVKISSRPKLPMTLVDYGRNLENVKKITDFLMNSG